MTNLQALLSDKCINIIANEQLFMVRGGKRKNCNRGKSSVKKRCSNKSFGSRKTRNCVTPSTVAPNPVLDYSLLS